MLTIDRDFESRGTRCAGTLYLPDGAKRPPVIVLAHGFGAERGWRLPAFAERFVQAGFGAFLFDYRGFGDSDGEPRRVVAPRKHRQDIRAVVEHVRGFDNIDPGRLVLWGTSLGGGHALTIAADDASFAALIAHVPHVDAMASLAALPDPLHAVRLMAAGVRDAFHAATFREPYYIGNVGHPGDLAMLNTEDSYEGMLSLLSPGEPFDNRCAARIALTFAFYRPILHAAKIRTPTLIVAAVQDSLIPIEAVRKTAARIPDCKLVELDCPHFAPYTGEWFERSISAQLTFLRERFGQP
jgi:pimeloyl-ACP methyl ester carboxylesterase